MDSAWIVLSFLTLTLVLILSLDDLVIDLVALFKKLGPQKLGEDDLAEMHNLPQKKIAIMIANWKEDDIIERMVHGNIGRIDYTNYYFFLGVYPNDTGTIEAAKRLQTFYQNVFVVENSQPGPTSKGQMLNQIVHHVRSLEIKHNILFDIFLMQDSEDIIHPFALKLINYKMKKNDFLQTPVLSLECHWGSLTRGTYIDEFAESHTRDLLVRNALKASVPSAGVGTAMSRLFVEEMLRLHDFQLFKEDTLTEDYHLGMMAHKLGFNSEFACCYIAKKKGKKDVIATREYFPSSVSTSIRQKTRWTIGICIQGFKNIGWARSFKENYFLWRDRRGLVNTPVLILSYTLSLTYVLYFSLLREWPDFLTENSYFQLAFTLTMCLMAHRILQRIRLVSSIYDLQTAALIPARWFVANYVNSMAAIKAVVQHRESVKTGQKPKWIKTVHELPKAFGRMPNFDLTPPPDILEGPELSEDTNQELQ